jgi:hypothetical protein
MGMARVSGLEPATPSLGVLYAIESKGMSDFKIGLKAVGALSPVREHSVVSAGRRFHSLVSQGVDHRRRPS